MSVEQWTWSGFGSLGGGQVNHDDLNFMAYDDDWSFDSDNVLGLQMQVNIAPQWSLTTQVVAQGFNANSNDDYEPEVDWLFVSYQWSPEIRLRLGRMRTPFYLYSDSVDAGYSYPWVRPPPEVYAFFLTPFNSFDGIDLNWNGDIQDLDLDLQLITGTEKGDYAGNQIKATAMVGTNITLRGKQWLLRYGLILNLLDIKNPDTKQIQLGFRQLADLTGDDLFNDAAYAFGADNEPYIYHAVGGQWDQANWTLLAEGFLIDNKGEGFSNNSKGWYLSWLYHIDRFTPYITNAWYINKFNVDIFSALENSFERYPLGSLGPEADLLRASTIKGFKEYFSEQRSWTFGTRYDFHSNACAKLEVSYFEFLDGTTGLMIPEPGAKRPDSAVLTSFTIDVVF